jgi:uncharacterized protein involved in type VI secretion and phage assembly
MAEVDLLGLLEGNLRVLDGDGSCADKKPHVYGVVAGVVTDVDDRKRLGRVRIRFPFSGRTESAWARVAAPWAGSRRRGAYFVPEVDDEVLVAFRDGDLGHPYVLGFLWSEPDAPPPEDSPKPGRSVIRSSRGHRVEIDDVARRVTVRTSDGNRVVLDDTEKAADVELADARGRVKVTLDGSTDELTITADQAGKVAVKATGGSVSVDAGDITIKATGVLTLEGQTVQITGHELVAINS